MKKIIYGFSSLLALVVIFGFVDLTSNNSHSPQDSIISFEDFNPSSSKIEIPTTSPNPANMYCCKICTKGKACGDTCISKSYTCHQPPGCACNG